MASGSVNLESSPRLRPRRGESKIKVQHIFSHLRGDILNGKLKPGQPLPTQEEVARQFGAGTTTASMALHRLAQEGLVIRIPKRGSFVAENQPTRTRVIDVVRAVGPRREPDPLQAQQASEPLWLVHLDHDLDDVARQNNWVLRWHHLREDEAADPDIIEQRFTDAKAVVVMVRTSLNRAFLTRLDHAGVPFAAVWLTKPESGNLPERAPYPQLTQDRQHMAEMAADHLIGLGHSEIGFVGTNTMPWVGGFLNAVTRHRLPMKAEWFVRVPNIGDADFHPSLRAMLSSANRPRAVVCETDHFAYDTEQIARELGLAIPGDLAIVSCMEGQYVQLAHTPMTTVQCSDNELFRCAAELAQTIGPVAPRGERPLLDPIVIPAELLVRESCGAKRIASTPGVEKGGAIIQTRDRVQ